MSFVQITPRNSWILGILVTAILFFYFFMIFYGIDFTDGVFHINEALHPSYNLYRFPSILSSLIIKGFSILFGVHLISFRIFNAVLLLSPILLAFFSSKTISPKKLLLYSCPIVLLIAPLNANVLGFDTFTVAINAVIFFALLKYFESNSKILWIITLAILTSMSIWIRLPNLILIFLIPILLIIEIKSKRSTERRDFRIPSIFVFSVLIITISGYLLYYRNFEFFYKAGLEIVDYEISTVIYNYAKDAVKIFIYTFFILSLYFIFFQGKRFLKRKPTRYFIVITLQFVFILAVLFWSNRVYNYAIYLVSLAISFAIISLFENQKKSWDFSQLLPLFFVSFLFVNTFGSNTGLIKASFLFSLFPFVLLRCKSINKSYWLLSILVLVPFAIAVKFFSVYEDSNFFSLTENPRMEMLQPINTTELRAEFLNEMDSQVIFLKEDGISVYFYGTKSHIFHYLYPESRLAIPSFYQPLNSTRFLPNIKKIISKKDKAAIFLISDYHNNRKTISNSIVGEELTKLGFKKVIKNELVYFLRN